jgi:hypothetical protein
MSDFFKAGSFLTNDPGVAPKDKVDESEPIYKKGDETRKAKRAS